MNTVSFNKIAHPVDEYGDRIVGAIFDENLFVSGLFDLEIKEEGGTTSVVLTKNETDTCYVADIRAIWIDGEKGPDDPKTLLDLLYSFSPIGDESSSFYWQDIGGNPLKNKRLSRRFIIGNSDFAGHNESDIKNAWKEIILKNHWDIGFDPTFKKGQATMRAYGVHFSDLLDRSIGISVYGAEEDIPQIDLRMPSSTQRDISYLKTIIHPGKLTVSDGTKSLDVTPDSIIGRKDVIHDVTLKGEGLPSSPLGVNIPLKLYAPWESCFLINPEDREIRLYECDASGDPVSSFDFSFQVGPNFGIKFDDSGDHLSFKDGIFRIKNVYRGECFFGEGITSIYSDDLVRCSDLNPDYLGLDLNRKIRPIMEVVNTLDNSSTTDALSAYQGKVLYQMIQDSTHLTMEGPFSSIMEIPLPYKDGIIYLVGDNEPYRMFVLVSGNLMCIGETDTDLSDYYTKTETDSLFNSYYTKTETETILGDYYNIGEVDLKFALYYTKNQIDSTLYNYYTKPQTNSLLGSYYTKEQVDTTLSAYLLRSDYVVVDNLLSTSTTSPLSANQGRILQGMITSLDRTVLVGPYDTVLDIPQPYVENNIYLVGTTYPYQMWALVSGSLVLIGDTEIDLSDYYTKTDINTGWTIKSIGTVNSPLKYSLTNGILGLGIDIDSWASSLNFTRSARSLITHIGVIDGAGNPGTLTPFTGSNIQARTTTTLSIEEALDKCIASKDLWVTNTYTNTDKVVIWETKGTGVANRGQKLSMGGTRGNINDWFMLLERYSNDASTTLEKFFFLAPGLMTFGRPALYDNMPATFAFSSMKPDGTSTGYFSIITNEEDYGTDNHFGTLEYGFDNSGQVSHWGARGLRIYHPNRNAANSDFHSIGCTTGIGIPTTRPTEAGPGTECLRGCDLDPNSFKVDGGKIKPTSSFQFPVGYVYISTGSTNPNTIFGYGTWSRIANGRVLVGVNESDTDFNTVKKSGGAKTHTLTVAQMPSHKHELSYNQYGGSSSVGWRCDPGQSSPTSDVGCMNTGGGGAHNNLQPYITVFMWERTA